jgi:cell division topological specificity factor
MSFLSRLFAKPQPASKDIAKERLRVVLIHDRTDVSPELLQTLKQEILAVISEHVIVDDEEGIEVTVSQTRGQSRLMANIPLLGMRRQPLSSARQGAARPKR